MLAVFSGGSGAGKNTIIEALIAGGGFALLPTYTTRDKRPGESEGKPYYYISNETFERKISEGEFYEYENVHGRMYGVSRLLLKERLSSGKILLKDIDVLGTQNLVKRIGGDIKLVTIFVKVASAEVLKERLICRGEKDIEKRLSRYEMETSYERGYDYIMPNEDLSAAVETAKRIILTEAGGVDLKLDPQCTRADEKLIEKTANLLRCGESVLPVYVESRHSGLYIMDGEERYLASKLSGIPVAKEIINGK